MGWKIDTAQRDVQTVLWSLRQGPASSFDTLRSASYRDTSAVIYPVRKAGRYYLSTVLRDAAGNQSPLRVDSVNIANRPPVIIRSTASISFNEDTLWQTGIKAYDWNNDTLRYSAVTVPAGVVVDSLTGRISWRPDDPDVGMHTMIVRVSDRVPNAIAAYDTFAVTVLNVNEPPVVTIKGDSTVLEDGLYRAVVSVTDPDQKDTVILINSKLPPYLVRTGDTLSGIPRGKNVPAREERGY